MREKQKQALQEELGDKVLAKIVVIQRWIRAKILRCRFLHLRRSAIAIQVHFTFMYHDALYIWWSSERELSYLPYPIEARSLSMVLHHYMDHSVSRLRVLSLVNCTLSTVCSEMLASQKRSRLSQEAGLLCGADSVSVEDLRCQEEADSPETGGHHPPGTLQRKAGSKEVCHRPGKV